MVANWLTVETAVLGSNMATTKKFHILDFQADLESTYYSEPVTKGIWTKCTVHIYRTYVRVLYTVYSVHIYPTYVRE